MYTKQEGIRHLVANESNRELRWQGASYSGTRPVFVLYLIF